MSFFNALQQYVTNSVASLNISPRRFSGSRENEETLSSAPDPPPLSAPLKIPVLPSSSSSSSRSPSTVHRSSAHLLQERSKSLKTVSSQPSSPRRTTGTGRAASLKESSSVSIAVPSASGGAISPSVSNAAITSSSINSTASSSSNSPSTPQHIGMSKRREPKLLPTFALRNGPRRTSWPQFAITGSGVQESDGSFFESYTALCWKQENRRLQVLREDDQPVAAGQNEAECRAYSAQLISPKEMEQLYVEVLYTIRHKLGAHSAKYPHHFKEDLVHYAQVAFGVGHEYHRRCNAIASEEKPPIVVLNVIVIEAEGLEAKDPNGFSDPYCMLGIQPGCCSGNRSGESSSPQQLMQQQQQQQLDPIGSSEELHSTSTTPSVSSERRDSFVSMVPIERLKKHSSFRLSFKRKEPNVAQSAANSGGGNIAANHIAGGAARSNLVPSSTTGNNNCNNSSNNSNNTCSLHGREQRDSIHAALPAKFIRATSVKNATLNPKWNEKFRFDIDDVCSDTLHLDIWDHDDEYSVLDAVSKLNEVRGVKGLGRFFKQIAQSARSGNQDDFLGCVNIPLQEIPSTGVECWYKLGGRSQRSTIQGRIHLKLWLSTREDLGTSEEDNWTEIKQQEKLHCVFIDFEVSRFKNSPSQWTGELSQAALTILHQHAIQGDVTVLQSHVVRWIAYAGKLPDKSLHFSVLYRILNELDHQWSSWSTEPLSREEEDALAESFTAFVDYSLSCLRKIRYLFSPRLSNSSKLEFLLKCLMQLDVMRAFRRCCPFHKEIRGEIVGAIRKGAAQWFTYELHRCVPGEASLTTHINGLTVLTNRVYADLTRSHQLYDDLFQKICNVHYFLIVYKNHTKMITQEYGSRLESIRTHFPNGTNNSNMAGSDPAAGPSEIASAENTSPVFELNIALQDLQKFQDHVPADETPINHQMAGLNCHDCFRVVLEHWLVVARSKALNRVRSAVELDSFTSVEPYLKHSTSAIDTTSCFYQVCDFWKQLCWPELSSSYPFVYSIVEMITASAIVYADLIFLRIQTHGFFSDDWKMTAVTEEVYVNLNNLQHVKNALVSIPQTLHVAAIVSAVDGPNMLDVQRSPVSGRSRSASVVSGTPASPGYLMIAGAAAISSSCVNSNSYESSARQAFHSLLETAREHYENKLLRIAGCLAEKMRGELKKNIFHLAWSPDSLPASQASAPLLDCLDHILLDLEPNLLPDAFHRCVAAIWDVLLVELWAQAEVSSGDKFCKFYDRLHGALQMIVNFLHADGKGLSLEALKCPTYQRVEEKISLHKARTEQLIDLYHVGRLGQQQQLHGSGTIEAPYGVLSIRVYFHHDSLSVEILSARDVIPLDPNGLSDPFVIVELLPRRLFPNCSEQQTTVKRRTLHPVFDECFEFPVTLEQCRQETAMLLFTVMDYDVLTANDFAGEALLSLNIVPGVATTPQGLDTFHGLKQIDLVLMHQPNKHHPILSVLESRVWDRTAQDFAKKQRERVVS